MLDQLTALAQRRLQAKQAEDEAVATRRSIDAEIAALLKRPDVVEGTVSEALDGLKVSVVYAVNRKLDTTKLQAEWSALDKAVQGSVKWKAELSTTEYRKLQEPERLALSAYLQTKPASPTVTVEATE